MPASEFVEHARKTYDNNATEYLKLYPGNSDQSAMVLEQTVGMQPHPCVSPQSIPDYLALVGDSADGYPGLRGWGTKSSAAVLGKFGHLESIPADWRSWDVKVASASALADTLSRERDRALLFRTLATLRTDLPLFEPFFRVQ